MAVTVQGIGQGGGTAQKFLGVGILGVEDAQRVGVQPFLGIPSS
jgi:hypothetical protein